MGSEVLGQLFKCCVAPEQAHSHAAARAATRKRIDRSMIGNPTDFRHTAHIGSGDLAAKGENHQLSQMMMSKGGCDGGGEVAATNSLHIVNARSLDEIRRK